MKHTLLIALLGATVTLATPTLSVADNGYKFKSGELHKHQLLLKKRRQQQAKKANNKQRFVAKKPAKPTRHVVKNKHGHKPKYVAKRHNQKTNTRHANVKKHSNVKHSSVKRSHNNKPSFSVSWSAGNSSVAYANHGLVNKKSYNKRHNVYRQQEVKRIYKRMHNQSNRIQNGIRNGQLVNREVRNLRQEQTQIKNTLSHYKRDGRVNKYERSRLNQLLDVARQNIQQKSNNHRTRYSQQQRHNNYNKYHNKGYNNDNNSITYTVQF